MRALTHDNRSAVAKWDLDTTSELFAILYCEIPKPAPRSVLASSHTCQKLPKGESLVLHKVFPLFIVYFYTSGVEYSNLFYFILSLLFMEHKYYMTISKNKGANFGLEA